MVNMISLNGFRKLKCPTSPLQGKIKRAHRRDCVNWFCCCRSHHAKLQSGFVIVYKFIPDRTHGRPVVIKLNKLYMQYPIGTRSSEKQELVEDMRTCSPEASPGIQGVSSRGSKMDVCLQKSPLNDQLLCSPISPEF